MVKRHDRKPDGKYHIGNQKYDMLVGSRAQVWHGTSHETAGGLKRVDLKMHKGHIVSKKKSELAKSQNILLDIFNLEAVVFLALLPRRERREREAHARERVLAESK